MELKGVYSYRSQGFSNGVPRGLLRRSYSGTVMIIVDGTGCVIGRLTPGWSSEGGHGWKRRGN